MCVTGTPGRWQQKRGEGTNGNSWIRDRWVWCLGRGRSYSPPVGMAGGPIRRQTGMGGGPIRRRQGWWAVLFAAGRDGGRASSGEVVLDTLRLGLDLSLSLLGGLQRPLLAVAWILLTSILKEKNLFLMRILVGLTREINNPQIVIIRTVDPHSFFADPVPAAFLMRIRINLKNLAKNTSVSLQYSWKKDCSKVDKKTMELVQIYVKIFLLFFQFFPHGSGSRRENGMRIRIHSPVLLI